MTNYSIHVTMKVFKTRQEARQSQEGKLIDNGKEAPIRWLREVVEVQEKHPQEVTMRNGKGKPVEVTYRKDHSFLVV